MNIPDQPESRSKGTRPKDTMLGRPIPKPPPIVHQQVVNQPRVGENTKTDKVSSSIEEQKSPSDKTLLRKTAILSMMTGGASDVTIPAPNTATTSFECVKAQNKYPETKSAPEDVIKSDRELGTISADDIPTTRPKDNNVGRPIQRPATQAEAENVEEISMNTSGKQPAESNTDRIFKDNPIRIPKLWLDSGFLLIVASFAGLVGLLAYSHVLSILADLAALPKPVQVIGYTLLALVLAVVLAGILKLALTYTHLAKRRQVVIRQIQLLPDYSRKKDEFYQIARNHLTKVIVEYPPLEKIKNLGIDEKTMDRLAKSRKRLEQDRPIPSRDWVDEFRSEFQSILDKAARDRVNHYALRVGIKTSISPYPFLDMMATLYNSFILFSELCVIYNRRMGRTESIYVLAWILINTYVSGEIHNVTESVVDGFAEQFTRNVPEIAKMVSGKMLEGTANYILIRRLGNVIIDHLQPING